MRWTGHVAGMGEDEKCTQDIGGERQCFEDLAIYRRLML
jgi:hypothetical protein